MLNSPYESERLIERALADLGELALDKDLLVRSKRLRALLSPDLARQASEQVDLWLRAAGKLERATELRLTRLGLEQSTDQRVARFRAARLGACCETVLDATAGIGGDAMQLAGAGLAVVGLDQDAVKARALRHNLALFSSSAWAVCGDAARPPVRALDGLVIDPDRRGTAGRKLDPRNAAPGWNVVLGLLTEARALACVKLAPGFDPSVLPVTDRPSQPHRWSWVSLGRELKELCLWTGPSLDSDSRADAGTHEAVCIDASGQAQQRNGFPESPHTIEPEELERAGWLFEVDRALVRADLTQGLATELDLAAVCADGGYLAGRRPGDDVPHSPWGRWLRIIEAAPLDPKQVRRMLSRHDIGPLTVKKRGIPTSADELARRLKGKGSQAGLLVVLRHHAGHRVWLVEQSVGRPDIPPTR